MKTDPVFIVITLNDSWNYIGSTQPVTRLLQKKCKLAPKSVFQPQSQPALLLDFNQFKVEVRVRSGQGARYLSLEIIKIMLIGTHHISHRLSLSKCILLCVLECFDKFWLLVSRRWGQGSITALVFWKSNDLQMQGPQNLWVFFCKFIFFCANQI